MRSAKNPVEIGSTMKNLDEAGYGRLLIEIALLDASYNSYSRDGTELLIAEEKRYRMNAQKIAKSLSTEFAERRKKRGQQRKARVCIADAPNTAREKRQ